MTRMIQVPRAIEKTRVTTAKTELKNTSCALGHHSSAQPITGAMLITVTAISAQRSRSTMKQGGTRAKASSRVSPTSTADGRNSAVSATR
jgi:hypothetical protein